MKKVTNIIIGALIFMAIDRISRVISSSLVDRDVDGKNISKKVMLRIELITFFLSLFIAFQFIHF
jgi:hypothetical protein